KIDYLNHIINVDSEVRFIEQLEEYLAQPENIFSQFDWWMFSKIDQTLDEVYIPYYSHQENKIANFYPDFIFWAQKGERYLILFVDPKAATYTDANYKIDGYKRVFMEAGKPKVFDGNVEVRLIMWGRTNTGEQYADFWSDNFDDFAKKIS
ncbi:MAG: restriction endonuclease subunit R, partial [Candidatus Omnitrophica bacterium]|nr:restriction endonuclease subunit R [Candidatus Omnitrophota bacterium]